LFSHLIVLFIQNQALLMIFQQKIKKYFINQDHQTKFYLCFLSYFSVEWNETIEKKNKQWIFNCLH
jgi:hypothetical protein